MKKCNLVICICFVLSGLKLQAQISTEELPVSFSFKENTLQFDITTAQTLPRLDMETINREDREREEENRPVRFGYRHPVHFTLDNSGQWTTLPNGDKLWKLDIYCPEALSVNLLYDKFHLPERAKFFVYGSDKRQSIGAFTSVNNKGTKENPQGFATGLIYGDKVTLEYYQPEEVTEEGIISIAYVVHGYRYIYLPGSSENITASGACQVNVNCSEGQNWQNEKNAVALFIVEGYGLCSGSLINTTANDGRPLFLTADHCLECFYDALGDSMLNYSSFYWNYESPNCTPTTYPTPKSTTGAVVVANNGAVDVALLRLTEDPRNKSDVNTYYLGWDRTGNAGTGGVGIHHPDGDVKKIATHNISPANSNCMNFDYCVSYLPNNNFWKINWMATTHGHSVTEGGSSGSPLLNNNHRVIGQLFGAGNTILCPNLNCSNPSADISNYGKFSVSWNNSTNPKRRLQDWLDPNNTGATILDGLCSTVNFTDQTVTSNTTVTSCGDINTKNVIVTNGAKLTLDVVDEVNITGDFEVGGVGSELEIK
ncbi:MAG: serine protease [Prevotellaceae bacterium]|jgi:hypothetical protein|nr:serine protease [Prevotellaceae bacterium]